MNEIKNEQWLKEYNDFLNSEASPPAEVAQMTQQTIRALLNPSPWHVFLKILGIHAGVGTLSLAICHQFGLNPFGTRTSLADWLMQIGGHNFCMIGCGILFTALSILAAGYFLSPEEIRVLRRTEFLQTFFITVLSLGALAFFGAQLAFLLGVLWLLGGIAGGYLATHILWKLKIREVL